MRHLSIAPGYPRGSIPVPIVVRCQCGKQYTVPDDRAGKRGRCAVCQAVFVAPTPLVVPIAPIPTASVLDLDIDTGPSVFRRRRSKGIWLRAVLGLFVLGGIVTMIGIILHADGPVPQPVAQVAKALGIADGLEPEQRAIRDHFLKYGNDPKSIEFVEWKPVLHRADTFRDEAFIEVGPYDSMVWVVIRGRNGIGALTVSTYICFLRGNKIVGHYEEGRINEFVWARHAAMFPIAEN